MDNYNGKLITMSTIKSFDVAIVGAGIAGCHLAQLLAHDQVSVVLIDQKPLPEAGPDWINAVPLWMFAEADLALPSGEELFDQDQRFVIQSPNRKNRIDVSGLAVAEVHMGHLGRRLKKSFSECKNATFIQAQVDEAVFNKKNRLAQLRGTKSDGSKIAIRAHLFVDASGHKGILRKSHPKASRWWPKTKIDDFCLAGQTTLEIKDRHGAENFLSKHAINPGDVLSDIGFSGGYSLFRLQIDKGLNHISLLGGTRALKQYKNPQWFFSQFIESNPWIGSAFIEGRGAIPINAPYQRLVTPGLALLGDAASQIYAGHASGIGVGLIAARMLKEVVVKAIKTDIDCGLPRTLNQYQKRFHAQFFQRLTFSEHFRRFSQSLEPDDINTLIEYKFLDEETARQTLLQKDLIVPKSFLPNLFKIAQASPRTFYSMMPLFKNAIQGRIQSGLMSLR